MCGASGWPSLTNCFKTHGEAKTKQAAMESRKDCCSSSESNANGNPAQPVIYSIHARPGYTWGYLSNTDPDTKTKPVDTSNYKNQEGRYGQYNFGFENPNGEIVGADGYEGVYRGVRHAMTVKTRSLKDWQGLVKESLQIWCVECKADRAMSNQTEREVIDSIPEGATFTPESDIQFIDPDDPEAQVPNAHSSSQHR